MLYDRRLSNDNCASTKVSTMGPAYNEHPAVPGIFLGLFNNSVLGTKARFGREQLGHGQSPIYDEWYLFYLNLLTLMSIMRMFTQQENCLRKKF